MKTRHSLLFAALCTFAMGQASAHGLWTEERRGHIEVVYGHGAEDDAYDPKKIAGAWAYDGEGKAIPVHVERLADHARLKPEAKPAVLAVAMDNGYWTLNAAKRWVNVGETQVPGALESGRYFKYSLTVLEEGVTLPPLEPLKLAILPQRDPLTVEAGEVLEVQVLVDGKPAAGIELYDDCINDPDHVAATTDAQGKAKVKVRNNGLNVIGASTEVPADDPDARVRGMFASLSFVSHHH